ncbi:MAG: LysM peptidoglycan-binding domain-containing protein, partial [Anaerolineales bacterium]|nr:LysM peptidoglycan-binding domain-containing protein [Anaerolineales bacterium]
MNKIFAYYPISRIPRFSAMIVVLLLAALACNIPWGNATSPESSSQDVDPNYGPSVTIQEPSPGMRVAIGESFDFFANAVDEAGVTRLDLWIDGVSILSQPAPDANGLANLSLLYPLVATQSGTYSLIARAYNSKGESSDSAVHYVTVVEANASAQSYAQYTVLDGETLESIAQRLGISVDDILRANPHLAGVGQVKPGQVLLIPLGVQQPVQAAVPAPGGGNPPGGQPAVAPNIVPVQNPAQPPAPPVLPPPPLPPATLNAPSVVSASSKGCQILLNWTDNASDETSYLILRIDPGKANTKFVAEVKPDTTQYLDNLSKSGKYGYVIEYRKRVSQAIDDDVLASSAPVWTEIPSSANCQNGSGPKQVVFEPVSFHSIDPNHTYGFVNMMIGGYSAIRVPRNQQATYKLGDWKSPGLGWTIPMPELSNMKAGDTLKVEVNGNGVADGRPPISLGQVVVAHSYDSLIAADSKGKVWEAKNANMSFMYRIWVEDWQWGGGSASVELPVPYDLKLANN